jgi:acyl-homoserine-lactone acylase
MARPSRSSLRCTVALAPMPNMPLAKPWTVSCWRWIGSRSTMSDPLRIPKGLGETDVAVQMFIAASQQVLAAPGLVDVAWGAVRRTVPATRDATFRQSVPASNDAESGLDDVFGPMRIVNPFPSRDGLKSWHCVGDGYLQLVEFSPSGVKAQALLSYGNALKAGSLHLTDQLRLFGRKELRKLLCSRDEVEKRAVSREQF